MDIKLSADVNIYLRLEPEQVALLIKQSATHYDARCRHASHATDGFLTKWQKMIGVFEPSFQVSTKFHEIDICLKILEYPVNWSPEEYKIGTELTVIFFRILGKVNEIQPLWKTEFTV